MPYLDQTVTPDIAQQLDLAFGRIYREMQDDPAFAMAPSAFPAAFRDAVGLAPGSAPVFRIPGAGETGTAPAPLRAIVFFHGSPGNLKAGLWLWNTALRGRQFTLIAPTAGAGGWDGAAGQQALAAAKAACEGDPSIGDNGVVLAGVGAGAEGVLQAVAGFGDRVTDVVLISPEIPSERMRSEEVRDRLRGRRVLILHGQDDLRKPIGVVREDTRWLWDNGVWLWLSQVGGDHHAFWSGGDAVARAAVDWIAGG
jgi:pimeloyl-ACP methyl ester carboxylesterase